MQYLPFKNLPSKFEELWAPDNGCINVPLVLRKLADLCQEHNVEIVEYARVRKITASSDDAIKVEVECSNPSGDRLEQKVFDAFKCAITAGAYTNHILEPSFCIRLHLEIWEMAFAYFACDPKLVYPPAPGAETDTIQALEGHPFKCMWFQFAKNGNESDPATSNLFYGLPTVSWGPPNQARIAVDNAVQRIKNPDDRLTNPSEYDIERTRKFIRKHIVGVIDRPVFAGTCLQTNLSDNMFVLDTIPEHRNVVVFTGGLGFKFVPLIGLILKQLLFDNGTCYDISHFKITRKGIMDQFDSANNTNK